LLFLEVELRELSDSNLGFDNSYDRHDLYFFGVPYVGKYKLGKDPVYTIQQGGKPPRFTLHA
jgi:hypothetical protein